MFRIKRRAGDEGNAVLNRLGQQRDGIERCRAFDPEEHPAHRHVPPAAWRHVALERDAHRVTMRFVARADRRHVVAQETIADHFMNDALIETGCVQIGRLLGRILHPRLSLPDRPRSHPLLGAPLHLSFVL